MDRLARNAMMARQAGMTYGKWKALQYVPPKPEEPVKVEPKNEYEVNCLNCGKLILKKNHRRVLYCDSYCGERYRYKKKNGLLELEEDNNG